MELIFIGERLSLMKLGVSKKTPILFDFIRNFKVKYTEDNKIWLSIPKEDMSKMDYTTKAKKLELMTNKKVLFLTYGKHITGFNPIVSNEGNLTSMYFKKNGILTDMINNIDELSLNYDCMRENMKQLIKNSNFYDDYDIIANITEDNII